jgi:hypothetical protein
MTAHELFPIVGVGASAGGIGAMRGFFGGLPQPFGAAVVVVTHLSPDRESLLPEVLARFTTLPVEAATDGSVVQPDHVYVMPPGMLFGIRDGRLTLTPLGPGVREVKPVDIFLTALALDRGERAVAVILSGGDGDGTIGIKSIKEHGGLTLAQAPDEDGPDTPEMPLSALRTGYVDYNVLEAAKRGDMRRGREVQQLDLAYPTSSLAFEAPERHRGILAGDRAPDAPLTGAAGQGVRVFDLLKGPHWTLIGFMTDRATPAPRHGLHIHRVSSHGALIDTHGYFRKAYGIGEGAWVLVRPDGYIGAIVAADHLDEMEGYLDQVGLTEGSSRESGRPSAAVCSK